MVLDVSMSVTMTAARPQELINLTSLRNHASILFATDEWFATAENLLNDDPPTFESDLFCEQGKVMDGWETRRRRSAGHDWCIIKLCSGWNNDTIDRTYMISRIELDTAFFTGNQAPRVSIEAMRVMRPLPTTSTNDQDATATINGIDNNEDYLYNWMPGASTRLARGLGGKGVRGTGQSPSVIAHALQACHSVARQRHSNNCEDKTNGDWITVLPMTPLQPGYDTTRYHTFEITDEVKRQIEVLGGVTHLKFNYFPDGGVARIKAIGHPLIHPRDEGKKEQISSGKTNTENSNCVAGPKIHPHSSPNPPPSSLSPHPHIELSSELHGGLGLACSNKHYGVPSNLLRPSPGKDMGDGWETARHPDRPSVVVQDPVTRLQDTHLKDWCVIKLGLGGAKEFEGVHRIIVDTRHFKGNFPESVTIDGCDANSVDKQVSDDDVCKSAGLDAIDIGSAVQWFPLVKRTHLAADAEHEFLRERGDIVSGQRSVTHVRISITPDGGLSRVRVYGSPARDPIQGESGLRSHL